MGLFSASPVHILFLLVLSALCLGRMIVYGAFENVEIKRIPTKCGVECVGGGCLYSDCVDPEVKAKCPGGKDILPYFTKYNIIPRFLPINASPIVFTSPYHHFHSIGACKFLRSRSPSCSGGGCHFVECSDATCKGGSCNFENPQDSLKYGYCNGDYINFPDKYAASHRTSFLFFSFLFFSFLYSSCNEFFLSYSYSFVPCHYVLSGENCYLDGEPHPTFQQGYLSA